MLSIVAKVSAVFFGFGYWCLLFLFLFVVVLIEDCFLAMLMTFTILLLLLLLLLVFLLLSLSFREAGKAQVLAAVHTKPSAHRSSEVAFATLAFAAIAKVAGVVPTLSMLRNDHAVDFKGSSFALFNSIFT